ncbi:hypothetical protein TTHERM_000809259 (macronuclear) [Tetrahymena thermophila SB210]|uniref:Uncharacterized protein n=1 Tax=Tetrahymena thermophila (strain SB210) TaxID=312017 RepID=W7XL08_TETTS|nr:hypothetical protein TTHERM_000809259 [Tetrahymena thermophila SB210]EWS75464.1 hypothetical protein TTHERM_000809259 [Tetrahymena thermophila SB210]|eukprot:XP_012652011.1 hypothetical protein TTHERM_000809259 [Tetrahymena thermophila SB210]
MSLILQKTIKNILFDSQYKLYNLRGRILILKKIQKQLYKFALRYLSSVWIQPLQKFHPQES